MACCPFHDDKHPSMKVDRRFHCFGCQADGDVIDFTARLFGLNKKDAALKLAEDFSVGFDAKGHDPPRRKPVKRKISEELRYRQAEQKCFRVLCDYLHLLERWEKEYAPQTPEEAWNPLFVEALSLAMANAKKAAVDRLITFQDGDATKMSLPSDEGIFICNPPYGQRMMEQQSAQRLYAALGRHLKYADGWKKFIITSEPEFEHYFGRRADKKRKLYNGMIKCDYYMYTDNSRKNQKRDDKK